MKLNPETEYITVHQVRQALQVGRKQVYKWIDCNQLPGTIKIGYRQYRIPLEAFKQLVSALRARVRIDPSS